MDLIKSFLIDASGQIVPYLGEISLATVATILAIYGDFLNKKVKKLVKDKPFLIRYLSFIFICAFGYGFLTIYFSDILAKILLKIPREYLIVSIIGGFICLGILADRKNQI